MRIVIFDEFPLYALPRFFTAQFDKTIPEWLREDVYDCRNEVKCYVRDPNVLSWLNSFLRMQLEPCSEKYSFDGKRDLIYVVVRNPIGGFDIYRVIVVEGCWL